VLEPNEKAAFDGMVCRLRADDPKFSQKVDRMCRPRRRFYQTMAILLWTMAPFSIFYGGWTGVFMAIVGAAYGGHLWIRRGGGGGQMLGSSARRPRTSSS
jgi:hypothetical protein